MSVTRFCLTVILFIVVLAARAAEPGFKSILTDKATKFLSEATKNYLLDYLDKPKNVTKKFKVSTVDVELSQIKVTQIDKRFASHLFLMPPIGVEHKIKNLTMTINAKYSARLHPVTTEGTVAVKIYKLTMSLIMRTKNDNGKLSLQADTCKTTIENFNLEFLDESESSKLLNQLTTDEFKRTWKNQLQDELCDYAKKQFVPTLTQTFTDLPTTVVLFDNYYFDYALIQDPSVTPAVLETYHKGQTFVMNNGIRSDHVPFESPKISYVNYNLSSNPKMAYVFMSNYSMGTLLYYLWKTGQMDYNITKDNVKPKQVVHLKTDCLDSETCASLIWPSVKKLYPKSFLEIYIKPTVQPFVLILPKKMNITNSGYIECYIRKPDNSKILLFSSDADLLLNIKKIELKDYSLFSRVTVGGYTLRNFKSSMAEVNEASMGMLMDFAKGVFFEPSLNKLLSNGIVLPKMLNFDMNNGTVEIVQDMLVASTDFCVSCVDDGLKKTTDANYEDYYNGG